MTIDSDLSTYMMSRIQIAYQPWTLLDLKHPYHQAIGAFVEKKLYPQGLCKLIHCCAHAIIALFSKKQAQFNAAKRFLDKGITRLPPILNFMIEFNTMIKNQKLSFPEMNFNNFNHYSYDHQFIFYWWTTRLNRMQLCNKQGLSCLKKLQMGTKRYQKLSLFRTLKVAQRDLNQWKKAIQVIGETLSDKEFRYLIMKFFEKIGKRTSDPIFVKKQLAAHWARSGQQSFILETASFFTQHMQTHASSNETLFHFYQKIHERQKMIAEILQKSGDFSPADLMPAFHAIPHFHQSFNGMLRSFQKVADDRMSTQKDKEEAEKQILLMEQLK